MSPTEWVIVYNGEPYRRYLNRDLAIEEMVRLTRWASTSDVITLEEVTAS